MHNFLSHIIHITIITEFEVLFYIYYIIPYERQSIHKMFSIPINIFLNTTYTKKMHCSDEQDRMNEYNDKLVAICYYYIGAINFFLFCAFLYDIYKVINPNVSIPRVLSSPKSWIQMTNIAIEETETKEEKKEPSLMLTYWNKSKFFSKMCETLQLIVLLGIFEYLFFAYLFNKFKIISAKLIACGIIDS